MAAGVFFFMSQETSSRGRTFHQHCHPHGQEEVQSGLWGLQLLVAAGWPRILVGIGGPWASGSVPELSALVISLGYEPINLLPMTWVQFWPRDSWYSPSSSGAKSLPQDGCVLTQHIPWPVLPPMCPVKNADIQGAPIVPAFRISRHKGLSV